MTLNRDHLIAGILFLSIGLLMIFGAIIQWPRSPRDLARTGTVTFKNPGRYYYVLSENQYEVLNQYNIRYVQNSINLNTETITGYNILVTDENGNRFIMALEVNGKASALDSGKTEDLFGRIRKLSDEDAEKQTVILTHTETTLLDTDDPVPVFHYCLSDGDETPKGNRTSSMVLSIAGLSCAAYRIIIAVKRNQL